MLPRHIALKIQSAKQSIQKIENEIAYLDSISTLTHRQMLCFQKFKETLKQKRQYILERTCSHQDTIPQVKNGDNSPKCAQSIPAVNGRRKILAIDRRQTASDKTKVDVARRVENNQSSLQKPKVFSYVGRKLK